MQVACESFAPCITHVPMCKTGGFPHTAGRFPPDTILIIITHGLALRIFLMRWLHWTVDQVRLHMFCGSLAATASNCHSDKVYSL